jgi:hypothetical protein
MIMEEFKKIQGFSQYEISSDGTIRMMVTKKVAKQRIHKNYGFKMCSLFDDNLKQRTVYPHKEVARAFIRTRKKGKLYVVHLNGDTLDNRVENLKWMNPSEAQFHQFKIGQRKTLGNPELFKFTEHWKKKHLAEIELARPKRQRIKNKIVFSSETHDSAKNVFVYEKPEKKKKPF